MKRKFKKRVLRSILALVVTLSTLTGSIPVMAADADNSSTTETTEYTEEAQRLRSEIDALISQTDKTRETYKTDYWGYCTVTNTHQGGSHTIYGNKARMCIAFKPLDGNAALSASLSTSFWGWTLHYSPNLVDSDGYYMYVGPWCDITYQGTYSMYYKVFTTGSGGVLSGRTASFHVWVDYQ